jgi:NO-binding membrane sensor protein with MHYT domain
VELKDKVESAVEEKTPLAEKIHHVLTEARLVLPGTQALLGFQLTAVLQSGFAALPVSSKAIYIVALVCLSVSVVLLMMPAAYHRIVERGEISERLHRFSSVAVLLAMLTLALALTGDSFITIRMATGSVAAAGIISGAWFALAVGTWFVLMVILRRRRTARSGAGGEPPKTPESQRVFAY